MCGYSLHALWMKSLWSLSAKSKFMNCFTTIFWGALSNRREKINLELTSWSNFTAKCDYNIITSTYIRRFQIFSGNHHFRANGNTIDLKYATSTSCRRIWNVLACQNFNVLVSSLLNDTGSLKGRRKGKLPLMDLKFA